MKVRLLLLFALAAAVLGAVLLLSTLGDAFARPSEAGDPSTATPLLRQAHSIISEAGKSLSGR